MAQSHGRLASFKLGTHATPGTLVDVSVYLTSASIQFPRDMAETTTFHATAKSYVPGLMGVTIPFAGPYDSAIEQQFWDLLSFGDLASWEFDPAGAGVTGTVKYTGQGYVSDFQVSSDVSSMVAMTMQLTVSGTVTRVTQ